MAETVVTSANGQTVTAMTGANDPGAGSALKGSQLGGAAATVSQAASATGGVGLGEFIQPDIDAELFKFESDETPIMSLMLNAKKVAVDSPEVLHYMIDEQRAIIYTTSAVSKGSQNQTVLHIDAQNNNLCNAFTTILVPGVDGYDSAGAKVTKGKPLMLFVVGSDPSTQNPIVMPINGPKTAPTDEVCTIPDIPSGSELIILSNALSETQTDVAPDLVLPVGKEVYLQKRGMTNIVSEYFDKQRKAIPFTNAIIAEAQIRNFKRKGNRTLLSGRKGKIKVKAHDKLGMQYVYTTEGIRWQVLKEFNRPSSRWTFEEFVALAKMFYTGEDVPSKGMLLCGKNVLEQIQSIDFSKHPEVKMEVTDNELGWSITRIKTVFGAIDIKREPAFDTCGWESSALLLDYERLVHYVYKQETHIAGDIEGHEVKVDSTIVWDTLALKGTCHIWINGEGESGTDGATSYLVWSKETAPSGDALINKAVYYLLADNPEIDKRAKAGQMWTYNGSKWSEYSGLIQAV